MIPVTFTPFNPSFLYFATFGERKWGRPVGVAGPIHDPGLFQGPEQRSGPAPVLSSRPRRGVSISSTPGGAEGFYSGVLCLGRGAGLITAHYSSARCHNGPAGVTRCGVVAFLPEETKMQCTIGGVIWPRADFMPRSTREGVNPSVAAPTPRSRL